MKPERIETAEFIVDHYLATNTRLAVSAYYYKIHGLIGQALDPANGKTFFENQGGATGLGFELEGEQRFRNGVTAKLSYSNQHAEDGQGARLTNMPEHLVKALVSAPLWDDGLRIGFETLYSSGRKTRLGTEVNDYVVSNLNLTGSISKHFDLSFAIYNLWNAHYADPVGDDFVQDRIFQDGRSFRLKVEARF